MNTSENPQTSTLNSPLSTLNSPLVPPGYKQTEVGVIPENWKIIDLSHVCTLQRGFDITESTRVPGTVPVYSSSGISYYHNKAMVSPPGVVTGRKGILGKVFLINEPFWPHDTTLWVKDFRGNAPAYVALVLQSFHLERLDAATSVPTLNRNNLAGYSIALPSTKAEQEAIAEALSDADALLESLEQLLTKKRHLKQAAMQELLTGKTRLPGFSGEWEVKRLGMLAVLSKSGVNPASSPNALFTHFSLPAFDSGAMPVVEEGGRIGSNKFLVPNNAVLLSKLNPRIPRIWAPSNIPENAVCSTEFLVLVPNESTDRNYLANLCSSPAVCYQMELHAVGTTGSHQRIHPLQALAIEGNTPRDKAEQTAIAAILSDMDAEIAALETKLTKTRQLKQGMMQELLTGRIRLI